MKSVLVFLLESSSPIPSLRLRPFSSLLPRLASEILGFYPLFYFPNPLTTPHIPPPPRPNSHLFSFPYDNFNQIIIPSFILIVSVYLLFLSGACFCDEHPPKFLLSSGLAQLPDGSCRTLSPVLFSAVYFGKITRR